MMRLLDALVSVLMFVMGLIWGVVGLVRHDTFDVAAGILLLTANNAR